MADDETFLMAAVDTDGEICEGSVGFYNEDQLAARFPDCTLVKFKDDKIPVEYVQGHYEAVEKDGKHKLVPKSVAAIKVIEDKKIAARKPAHLDSLMALSADDAEEPLKTLILYSQAKHVI